MICLRLKCLPFEEICLLFSFIQKKALALAKHFSLSRKYTPRPQQQNLNQ